MVVLDVAHVRVPMDNTEVDSVNNKIVCERAPHEMNIVDRDAHRSCLRVRTFFKNPTGAFLE